ncbi:SH3 domain-containing protein 19 isoform X2 [Stigmatopora argus]
MADVKPKEDKVDQVDVISQSTDHLDRRKAVLCSPDTLDENKNWFSPPPLVFPSSTSCSCSASIKPPPSYDQVIQEKTLEGRIVRPTAAPRRSESSADPIKEKSAGQKPQKPPRRSAPIPERLSEIDPGLERTESATDETPHPPSVSVWASETRPIPLPRTKSRKPRRDNVESLIRFEDDDVSMNGSSEDYPKEPLGVFNPSGDRAFSGEMSASNAQPNIYAKIQSFDSQTVSEDRIKPHPFPRKPPKPLPTAASFPDGQNAWSQDPTPTFPPRTPPKPASKPLRDELESLLSKGGPPHRSRPVLTRGDSTLEEPPLPPRPPAKPAKEPLKANLNANNHNSTGIFKENARPEPNPPPVLAKAPPRRRPTTIRVPSQIAPESPASKAPPPLPARKPVGSVDAARAGKQKPLPSLPAEAEPGYRPLPLPPNRQKDTAPTKVGPGRPPPPKATKGFVLPPRPLPGHQLYDKYAVPHGSAATDLNRNETGEVDFQAQSPASQREHGLTVQAMHDFTPEGPGELGLKSGDVVTAVERVDAEWYRGTCRGSAGYFPVNFVKVIPGLPKTVPQKKPKPPPSKVSGLQSRASLDLDDQVSGWAMGDAGRSFPDNLPSNHPKSRTLPNRVTLPCSTCEFEVSDTKGRAMYDFNSKRDEELSFQVGDIITDLESLDDEWFLGDLRGKRALVPKNYIQIL